MRIKFPPSERAVNEPIRLDGVAKSYGERTVLNAVHLKVQRGERIGIIGVNGAGKTTLLRMIANEIEPSDGKIVIGNNIQVGYYAQHHAEALHRDATVYQEIAAIDPTASVTRVRSVLGAFLFSDDDVEKKIGVLSGGERARVALARLLIKPGNLLLMDEPTNHLDLASSEALAESLESFDGTLIFVSHNRAFVRRLATRIWNVADGKVETYPGTLDEYMDSCRQRQDPDNENHTTRKKAEPMRTAAPSKPTASLPLPTNQASSAKPTDAKPKAPEPNKAAAKNAEPSKPTSPARPVEQARASKNRVQKLEREVKELESKIAALEKAQRERSDLLADPGVYADKQRSSQLLSDFKNDQPELDRLTTRWEVAQGELEAVAAADSGEVKA
jgi:ATP-binding cassette subfamily F protein 3